jgi:hypothetical protein
MKLAALCCTYLRPAGLGQLIECFLRQDYPCELRELVILDDAGQYENQTGECWRLISIPHRFNSLGEKRNACAALASPDVEGFLIADDDDIYMPHWFRTQAEALRQADWSRPGLVLLEHNDALREVETDGLYHGGWAFRKSAFQKVIGYGPHNNGEDQELARRLHDSNACEIDPCTFASPFYVYRYDNASYHLSYMDDRGYRDLGSGTERKRESIAVGWTQDWTNLPVIRRFTFGPHVNPKSDRTRIELIGPVFEPGTNGPQNGMYALQKELRKRIDEGLDWFSIKPLPVSKGAIPWFWNWQDRRYAMWWDSEGLPFIQGPNMLFVNSATPRIDREECALLDSSNCLMMFCHSEWYRDLILANRGTKNKSEIVMWPYPIDPMPEGPLPAEYDLLIYAKNGHRPGLLEHLAELYPNHIQFHYGQYKRADLIEAARRSRACAYLADDDHGPLALQEILLAGCPSVGVSTGASLVCDGVTGYLVKHLPPGERCIDSDRDMALLTTYMGKIRQAMDLNRHHVCAHEYYAFSPQCIASAIIEKLEQLQSISFLTSS